MITTSLHINNKASSNISPEWYSSTSYDYCEPLVLRKRPGLLRSLIELIKDKKSE